MTPTACNVLRKSGNGELIVAADFSAAGRSTATFTDLAAALKTDRTVWEIAPPPYGREAGMTGAEQADRWTRDVRASGARVHAVLGFCSGSVYAGELAERIARWQEPPLLVLLDPEPAERRMLLDHYERLVEVRFGPVLAPAEIADAVAAGRAADAHDADPLALASSLAALCRQVAQPAFARTGLGAERTREFVALFTAYLHWLAAATQLDVRAVWSRATALNSNSPGSGLHVFPAAERAGLVARALSLDVSHAELMRDAGTAAAVDALLG